jgi:hypothetical protein
MWLLYREYAKEIKWFFILKKKAIIAIWLD